jgi:Ca-activated chloride channel homolog
LKTTLSGVAARRGKPVVDLSQNDIAVQDDNKAPAAILGFRIEQELPLRVGVAIDTSSSVTSRFRFEQAAASAFFRQAMNPDGDVGFVMGFENFPTVTQDFVGDPDLLSQGVELLSVGGGTAFYDAVRTACQKLRRPEQNMVARVLVVLSDGQNDAGEVSLEGAIDAAQEAEVTIYAISTNYPTSSSVRDSAADQGNSDLRKLAEQTGGRVLFPSDPKAVAKAFAKIGEELRSRYAVSYKPADFKPDGRYRKIKIEARKTGEKLEVHARKGYRARPASSLSSYSGGGWQRNHFLAIALRSKCLGVLTPSSWASYLPRSRGQRQRGRNDMRFRVWYGHALLSFLALARYLVLGFRS